MGHSGHGGHLGEISRSTSGGYFLSDMADTFPAPFQSNATREEWRAFFSGLNDTAFGADPSLRTIAEAALAAVMSRGWQDAQTKATVKAWQEAHQAMKALPALAKVDGIYGPASATALGEDLQASVPPAYFKGGMGTTAAVPTITAPSAPLTSIMPQAPRAIDLAQTALQAGQAQGWGSAAAHHAVEAWQRARGGVHVDGLYGPETARVLSEDLKVSTPPAYYTADNQVVGAVVLPTPAAVAAAPTSPPAVSVEKVKEALKAPMTKNVAWAALGLAAAFVAYKGLTMGPKKTKHSRTVRRTKVVVV